MMKETVIGHVPNESGFRAVMRRHQGWWRAFVLNLPEGNYQTNKREMQVCNRINNGDQNPDKKNFLSKDISDEVHLAQSRQKEAGKGIMETDRLYNNLLSSQPLAFNFFGFFRANPDVALAFLQTLRPDIIGFDDVLFEYAPQSSRDSSAFDFGFVVRTKKQKGFIGFECKYTDQFSYQRTDTKIYYGDEGDKNHERYHELYKQNSDHFPDDYYTYVRSQDFNQLFRNELLGVQLRSEFDFLVTGLFCHHDDHKTVAAGQEFQKKIGNGWDDFILLTYADYFERMQKLDLNWEQRELIMMLWARYCGLKLSNNILMKEKK